MTHATLQSALSSLYPKTRIAFVLSSGDEMAWDEFGRRFILETRSRLQFTLVWIEGITPFETAKILSDQLNQPVEISLEFTRPILKMFTQEGVLLQTQ